MRRKSRRELDIIENKIGYSIGKAEAIDEFITTRHQSFKLGAKKIAETFHVKEKLIRKIYTKIMLNRQKAAIAQSS